MPEGRMSSTNAFQANVFNECFARVRWTKVAEQRGSFDFLFTEHIALAFLHPRTLEMPLYFIVLPSLKENSLAYKAEFLLYVATHVLTTA